jgi:threonine aldolase
MNFASDNVYGVHPKILASLSEVNDGTAPSYGGDDWSKRAEARLREVFETEVAAFLVTTGTAANGLALQAIVPGHGAIFCHAEAHVAVDECNAPEFFTGGAKLLALQGAAGKIAPDTITRTLKGFIRGEHDPKPAAISIANATELGTVYSPGEIAALSKVARAHGMKLHMDGARFANALVSAGCSAAEITWKSGVDVLSFGGTKNGGMLLEAVVFFDTALAADCKYRRMRGGQLVSKSRYLGAQMLAYLADDLWLDNARRANALARRLAEGLKRSGRAEVPHPVQANEVFAILPRALSERLLKTGANFYEWMPDGLGPKGLAEDRVFVRFVLSFATPESDVERFITLFEKS